ncbi:MAG: hypothetical protein ACK4YF_08605, partial [Exilispira sp.]
FIGGIDIKKIPKLKLREIISVVSQENFFWSSTIKENVILGRLIPAGTGLKSAYQPSVLKEEEEQ